MRFSYQSNSPVAMSIIRFDGLARNFASGTWETPASPPSAGQYISLASPAMGMWSGFKIADLPVGVGPDIASDASSFGSFWTLAGSYYLVPQSSRCLCPSKVFTWMSWVKWEGTPSPNSTIIGEGSSTNNNPLFQLRSDEVTGTHAGIAIRDNAGFLVSLSGSKVISNSEWHHVAATCDGSMITLYVDGSADGSASISPLGTISVDRLCFGSLTRDSAICPWNGGIGDIRSYPRALSSSEISSKAEEWISGPNGSGDLTVIVWNSDPSSLVPTSQLDQFPLSWVSPGQPMAGGID